MNHFTPLKIVYTLKRHHEKDTENSVMMSLSRLRENLRGYYLVFLNYACATIQSRIVTRKQKAFTE
jgi:hypothetical protein